LSVQIIKATVAKTATTITAIDDPPRLLPTPLKVEGVGVAKGVTPAVEYVGLYTSADPAGITLAPEAPFPTVVPVGYGATLTEGRPVAGGSATIETVDFMTLTVT